MRFRCCVTLILSLGMSAPLSAFTTVGPQANCGFRTTLNNPIQLALNAGHTEIRLVGGTSYNGSIVIGGSADVSLRGGFTDCTQATNNSLPSAPQASVLVAGASRDAGILMGESNVRRRSISLSSIELRPNLEQNPTGPGIWVSGLLDARLERSRITGFNNAGRDGGGVLVLGGTLQLTSSEISQNRAQKGGGVYCSGGTVRLDPASRLLLNQAVSLDSDGDGGGAYLMNCTFRSEGRVLPSTLGGTSGIIGNQAGVAGGGLYIFGGFTEIAGGPFCTDAAAPVCLPRLAIIGANSAQIGGAIFARNNAEVQLDFANVSANTAIIAGGGFVLQQSSVRFGGQASIFPNYDRSHCSERICEVMSGNRVRQFNADAGSGGAVRADDSDVVFADVLFDDNTAFQGSVFDVRAGSALLQQILVRNPDRVAPVGQIADFRNAQVEIRRSTIVIEPAGSSVAANGGHLADPDPQSIIKMLTGSLEVNDTLLAGLGTGVMPLIKGAAATLTGTCNAYAGAGIDPGLAAIGLPIMLTDVAADGSFAPAAGSRLIDRCVGQDVLQTARDIQGAVRRVAQSDATLGTPMDIGAHEVPGSLLFRSGFE